MEEHSRLMSTSGWFQFNDGGSYVGEVDPVRGTAAHGFGVARGPDGHGEYAGSWSFGFEQSGSFVSSSGSDRYEGQWSEGKRNGLGVERRGGWIYRGEWANGLKGCYGLRQSSLSSAKYEGTWANGLQNGYGVETSADGGTYQGHWLSGLRHGYGIRQSATYERMLETSKSFKSRSDASQLRSTSSKPLTAGSSVATAIVCKNPDLDFILRKRDRKIESGGGFVLTEDVAFVESHRRFGQLLDRLRRSPGFPGTLGKGFRRTRHGRSINGTPQEGGDSKQASPSVQTQSLRVRPSHEVLIAESGAGAVTVDEDEWSLYQQGQVLEGGLMERYCGEWKKDRRAGYGACQRSDGLRYEGEWLNDKKNGYGRTTLPDGSKLEGKYKNNVLVSSVRKAGKRPKFFKDAMLEKVEIAVKEAQLATENAKQKAEIAQIRVSTAQVKANEADMAAREATRNSERAHFKASEKNEHDAQPGDHLTMHRIDEDEFLVAFDASEVASVTDASKERTGPSSFRLRLPFILHIKQQLKPDHSSCGKRGFETALTKWFPWQKTKAAEATTDQRSRGIEEPEVTGGHLGDQSHLQQPFVLGMNGGGEDRGPYVHGNHRLAPSTGDGQHFESRVMEQIVVPQLHSTTFTWPGIGRGGFRRGELVGGGRRDLLRKELMEAVEPAHARYPRRNSLPCIVKDKVFESSAPSPSKVPQSVAVTKSPLTPKTDNSGKKPLNEPLNPITPPPPPHPSHASDTETYLIDRGLRKRVKYIYEDVEKARRSPSTKQTQINPSFRPRPPTMGAMSNLIMSTMVTGFALTQSTPLRDWTHDSTDFRKMYSLESPTLHRKTKAGSTSDVSTIKPSEMMSREAVYVMSQRKREELIQKRAEEEARRKRGEIVISISALQDCRVVLALLFLLVSGGLMIAFYDHIRRMLLLTSR